MDGMIGTWSREDKTMTLSRVPITSDPERMSGKVCIGETRMPVAELLIHLTQGGSIHTFASAMAA